MLIFLHTAWHQSQHSVVFDINNTSITNISVVESESESLSFCSFSMIFVSIHLQLPTLVPTLQILLAYCSTFVILYSAFRTFFKLSCSARLLVINYFSFCSSEDIFI